MITVNIYNAFAPLVTAFAASYSPELEVAYPDLPFTPPDAGAWLEIVTSWNEGENYGWSDDGPTVEMGFFRVIVCYRSGVGIVAAQTIAEAVRSAIPKGTEFGGARAYRKPSISGRIQDDDKSMVPVTVWWRATS